MSDIKLDRAKTLVLLDLDGTLTEGSHLYWKDTITKAAIDTINYLAGLGAPIALVSNGPNWHVNQAARYINAGTNEGVSVFPVNRHERSVFQKQKPDPKMLHMAYEQFCAQGKDIENVVMMGNKFSSDMKALNFFAEDKKQQRQEVSCYGILTKHASKGTRANGTCETKEGIKYTVYGSQEAAFAKLKSMISAPTGG